MSYFDDASLVMIPSGYKDQKVYSVKPLDGSGDLTFSRASSATRVASNGLIEKVRTNRALYSEDFSNAAWTKGNCVVTGSQADPNGGTSAFLVTDDATNDLHYFYQFVTPEAGEFTFSYYAKANTLSHCGIRIYDGVSYDSAIFNLTNGTKGSGDGAIESVGNGWYRVSLTKTISSSFAYFNVFLSNGSTYSYSGSGQSIYVFGAQYESGVMTDYIATTSAAVSVGPVSGLPRLDYLGSTCGKLLLEPQRTNQALYSEQFNNAAWTIFNATITANTSVSPDGYTNADTAVVTSNGYIYQAVSSYAAVSGQSVTISVFAKNQISNFLIFGGASPAGTDVYKIENYGNGWYRHSVVRTFTATTTGTLQYLIAANVVGTHVIWGAQIEGSNSAYATSYIPTLGTSVTRVADAASKTGISSLIGQTEGVLFADFVVNGKQSPAANILNSEKNTTAAFFMGVLLNNTVDVGLFSSGSAAARITGGSVIVGQRAKVAYAYKSGSSALYINGTLIGTSSGTFTFPTTLDDIFLNDPTTYFNYQENVSFNQVLLFKTRLTNAQLAELTTL